MTKRVLLAIFLGLLFFNLAFSQIKNRPIPALPSKTKVSFWLTNPETKVLFQLQKGSLVFGNLNSQDSSIMIDPSQTFQTIDGFGNCLTGGSATLLHRMDAASRSKLLKELFATDGNNIGFSYLRVSIGASDLSDRVFSYNDLPEGVNDPEMNRFSLEPERVDLKIWPGMFVH